MGGTGMLRAQAGHDGLRRRAIGNRLDATDESTLLDQQFADDRG
jgi:hypothetical protein